MDPNPFVNPPVGYLLIGLAAVLLLAAAVYLLGAWGAGKMRQGSVEESTAIPYPDRPQSEADREVVRHARAEPSPADQIVSEEQLAQLEVGADRKIVPQTPTQAERPVDAADRNQNPL